MGQEMILELKEIYKSFGAVKALKGVSFSLRKGTVHAIVGENGAGKSTLMKVLSGMYQPDNGEIWLEGRRVTIANETEGINLGISMIYQELNSVLDMTVMDNIFLGQEITCRLPSETAIRAIFAGQLRTYSPVSRYYSTVFLT